MQRKINPMNNLPEPLGTIVILANFFIGIYNFYSNNRQESRLSAFDKKQSEILSILKEVKTNAESV